MAGLSWKVGVNSPTSPFGSSLLSSQPFAIRIELDGVSGGEEQNSSLTRPTTQGVKSVQKGEFWKILDGRPIFSFAKVIHFGGGPYHIGICIGHSPGLLTIV